MAAISSVSSLTLTGVAVSFFNEQAVSIAVTQGHFTLSHSTSVAKKRTFLLNSLRQKGGKTFVAQLQFMLMFFLQPETGLQYYLNTNVSVCLQ